MNLQGKQKLVRKIREFEQSGVKLPCATEEGNDFWLELSAAQIIEGLRNWNFTVLHICQGHLTFSYFFKMCVF